ncbi:MAG: hypothetical protein R6W89_09900 [Candidatus Hydrogenedentota bacterium]
MDVVKAAAEAVFKNCLRVDFIMYPISLSYRYPPGACVTAGLTYQLLDESNSCSSPVVSASCRGAV